MATKAQLVWKFYVMSSIAAAMPSSIEQNILLSTQLHYHIMQSSKTFAKSHPRPICRVVERTYNSWSSTHQFILWNIHIIVMPMDTSTAQQTSTLERAAQDLQAEWTVLYVCEQVMGERVRGHAFSFRACLTVPIHNVLKYTCNENTSQTHACILEDTLIGIPV